MLEIENAYNFILPEDIHKFVIYNKLSNVYVQYEYSEQEAARAVEILDNHCELSGLPDRYAYVEKDMVNIR